MSCRLHRYLYAFLVPVGLWAVMRYWAGVEDRSPADMVALYGYGMFIWIIVAVSDSILFATMLVNSSHQIPFSYSASLLFNSLASFSPLQRVGFRDTSSCESESFCFIFKNTTETQL